MAHELTITNGAASMMYVEEEPWHGLGTRLDKPATSAQAIKAAKLDWEVEKAPLSAGGLPVKDRFGVVKYLKGKQDKVLGIVGRDYTPLQNTEAFEFFDSIVGGKAAIYHTAGSLDDDKRVWILAKMPDSIRVVGDDITDKYLLLSNSYDGTSGVRVMFTPVRVVCQNTLTLAQYNGGFLSVPHRRGVKERLAATKGLLGIINNEFKEIERRFQRFAAIKMNSKRLNIFLEALFPYPDQGPPFSLERQAMRYERLATQADTDRKWSEYFFVEGKGIKGTAAAGTLWAALNGVTEYVDHRVILKTAGKRLSSVWFGRDATIKRRAYAIATDKAINNSHWLAES